jgi:hypothetical protein
MSERHEELDEETVPATAGALAARCRLVAERFRFGRDPEGHAALPSVLAGLERSLAIGLLDAGAAAPILQAMLDALERQDLLLVADLLEHIVAPSLD